MNRMTLLLGLVVLGGFVSGCVGTPEDEGPEAGETAIAPEPKHLEERVFITMGDMFFADSNGTQGGVFHVSAEKTVGFHFKNDGNELHEVFFGRDVVYQDGTPDGFVVSLFADVPADVFIYQPAKTEVATERGLAEIEIDAGGQVWIRTMFPAEMKGEWELACFVPGHYEQGMKATLIIE